MNADAAKIPAGSDGLEWAPYLLGERTPHLDPEVRAAFAGIGVDHTAATLFARCRRASPIRLQDTFTLFAELGIPVSGIRLGGGGARGALWRKIQAGIYGQAVEVLTRKRRCLWLRADGRRRRGPLGQSGRGLRAGHRSGAAHRARCGDVAAYKTGYAAVAQTLPGAEDTAVNRVPAIGACSSLAKPIRGA